MSQFTIIVGYRASDRAIGMRGILPWKIPKDMVFFRKITKGHNTDGKMNAVIMGRNTFESMNYNPLPGRINYVCTSMDILDMPEINLYFVKTLEEALEKCKHNDMVKKIFVIGGAKLYSYAIQHPSCNELIINEFSPCVRAPSFDIDNILCDTFFPEINTNEYELTLDYNSIDSIAEIKPAFIDDSIENEIKSNDKNMDLYVKIRYKKYLRKLI
jgi:dihydrofolate reductase